MTTYWLKLALESDATFGRGDGVAGLVDAEVQHSESGLPYLGGKTLKGLLHATADEILDALQQAGVDGWENDADSLFGEPGSSREVIGGIHVGDAELPADLRDAIAYYVQLDRRRDRQHDPNRLTRARILESLTTLRRQTAMDPVTGAPLEGALRTTRVIVRNTPFIARLDFMQPPTDSQLAFLAACSKGLRRLGTNRNRGLGRVSAELYDTYPQSDDVEPVTDVLFKPFKESLQP